MEGCIVMEYAGKGDLRKRRIVWEKERGGIPEKDVKRFMWDVLRGLKVLHDRGIAFRDLKGSNVVVAEDARRTAKLTDFGLATHVDINTWWRNIHLYIKGFDPALKEGKEQVDLLATDVYAFGTMVYEILAGLDATQVVEEEEKGMRSLRVGDAAWALVKRTRLGQEVRPKAGELLEDPWFDEVKKKEGKKLKSELSGTMMAKIKV